MQHDTTDAAQSIKRGGTFRHFASLSEMHIRGTRNDESLASWPSVSPKADASAQGFGDHQYASDAVARKPAARQGPAQPPFKPRRYRSRRANDAAPSRRRRAAPRVLEIATSAPPDPFLALVGARARRESDPRSTPTLTSCQRAGRRPDLRVVPPPSSLVQFLPRETRREKTRPRSAANICVGVR